MRPARSSPRILRVVERLAAPASLSKTELKRVDDIAAKSFEGQRFSFGEELGRPWTRAWLARAPGLPVEDGRDDWEETGSSAGEVVAFLVAWHVADELHVLHVATDEAARRMGHGEALMRIALAYAADSGVRMVLLEVRRSNRPAIKLYRKLCFTALGLRPRYYADGEDAVEMVLNLDPLTGETLTSKDEVRLEV